MAQAVFFDKVGETEKLDVRPGQTVKALLRAHGIPANCVITRVNKKIVAEEFATIAPEDYVEIQQIRHYDLKVCRRPERRVFGGVNPIYAKEILVDEAGRTTNYAEQFDSEGFVRYVETAFAEGVTNSGMFQAEDKIAVGLSGGRDSVSFLKLMERTADRLPKFKMTAVTVSGLPDWDEPETFAAARHASELQGINWIVVPGEKIQSTFRLKKSYALTMNEVVAGDSNALTMVISHHVLRRMIEIEAEERGIGKIVLGLNSDDLVATLVTWFTSGFRLGPLPIRPIGKFNYVFPLYRVTKKELTLYLELLAPELNQQGPPGRFTSGPGERSMSYAVADHLYDLWPGIDYYLFDAFKTMQTYMKPPAEASCGVCGGTYLLIENVENPHEKCDVCTFFESGGYSEPSH